MHKRILTYIALNQNQLSRLGHHWLWGLTRDNSSSKNLWDAVEILEKAPSKKEELQRKIESINSKNRFMRGLYWLFNIDQYRFHYYQLQAYWSWQLFQKGASMPIINNLFNEGLSMDVSQSLILGAFAVGITSFAVAKILPQSACASLLEFSTRLISLAPELTLTQVPSSETSIVPHTVSENAHLSSPTTAEIKAFFIVRPSMLKPLQRLKIEAQVGQKITLNALRSVYKQLCLETHPDIHKGSSDKFIKVNQAYEALLKLIQKEQDISLDNESCFDTAARIQQEIVELQQENQRFQREVSEIDTEIDTMSDGLKEIRKDIHEFDARARTFDENAKTMGELERQFVKRSNEYTKAVRAHISEFDEEYARLLDMQCRYAFFTLTPSVERNCSAEVVVHKGIAIEVK